MNTLGQKNITMTAKNSWYIRKGEQVSGPFPTKLVSQRVLLGRIQLSDEASTDKENWKPIRQIAELIPDLLRKDQKDPFVKERIAAAKRWADERGGGDRRDQQTLAEASSFAEQRSGRERRQMEELPEVNYREERFDQQQKSSRPSVIHQPKSYTVHSLLLLVVVMAGVYAGYKYLPRAEKTTENNCNAPAAAKVNWSNCNLQGIRVSGQDMQGAVLKNANLTGSTLQDVNLSRADLSYAVMNLTNMRNSDLSQSQMIGASFRNADLTGVSFVSSNMAYANFTGATLLGVDFKGALLDKTIWFDGRECAVGSVGKCD